MLSNWCVAGIRDTITIEALDVECIIGLHDHERAVPQRVVVGVTVAVDAELAASQERFDATVDYEWVSTQIAFILKLGRFRLLEAAALTICRALLLVPVDGEARGPIQAIDLSLRKPGALLGRGVPLLRMRRCVRDVSIQGQSKPFGSVDVICETGDVGFYRLSISPGHRIAAHAHHQMDEVELILSTGLHCQGEPATRGTVRQWPRGLVHHYENPSDKVQSLLRVDRPTFIEDDQIPDGGVTGPALVQCVWEM